MHRFANPARFLRFARAASPLLTVAGLAATAAGLGLGLFASPPDYQQGDSVRIMYVHVPAAWLGSGGYFGMAVASAAALVWRHPLAAITARAIAPVGALFTAICLVTGSLWGKPTWGTYWQWDARLTSMLALLFLYLGYLALAAAEDERSGGEVAHGRGAAILALVGVVNLPIIKFSVEWWHTLHQGPSITLTGSAIDPAMMLPLFVSLAGFTLTFAGVVLMRMRTALARQRTTARGRRLAEAYA